MATFEFVDKSLLVTLGNNIRRYRLERGLSQEDLAHCAGLHRTYVSSTERGERNISVLNLAKLANALDIDLSTLLRGVSLDDTGE